MANREPQSIEAEQSLLGSLLISKDACLEVIGKIVPDDFYRDSHKLIYNAIVAVFNQDISVDITTVTTYLNDTNDLSKAGGVEYLLTLTDSVGSTAHVRHYLGIVEDKSLLRKLRREANNIIEGISDDMENVGEFIQTVEKEVLEVTRNRSAGEMKDINTAIGTFHERIELIQKNGGKLVGLSTTFPDLDKVTSGFQRGDLIILGARPSVGKTALALNFAQRVSAVSPGAVAVFSLEMPAEQLVQRMICSIGRLDSYKVRNGAILSESPDKYYAAAGLLAKCKLYIDDSAGVRVAEIASKCRRLKREKGLSLILIDYLQLISGSSSGRENRQQEVSEISRQLKQLARELDVPIIALSQLSRSVEQREDKRPNLSDLRESGAIEQDADIVAFLHRPAYYDKNADKSAPVETLEIHVAKNRNGQLGQVDLAFEKACNNFTSIQKDRDLR